MTTTTPRPETHTTATPRVTDNVQPDNKRTPRVNLLNPRR